MGNGIIYVTQCVVTGKIYVGIHTLGNKNYLGSGKYLTRAIKKYGRENFRRIDVDEFDSIEEGCCKERIWIQELNSKVPNGYNLNAGGEGQFDPCQELRNKLSVNNGMRGRHHTKETKQKMSVAHKGQPSKKKGRPLSETTKRKMSETMKGRPRIPPMTEELKKKISETLTGRPSPKKGRHYSKRIGVLP